ncbi:hypothetical protein [Mycobacterium sp.]|uniref:hypothetical protein n=1 Tax=Mycobacterium sp. TaxID=1785 RepID=UPI003D6C6A4B
MVAAAGTGSQGPGRAATMLAVVAVMAGMIFRLAATLALLLTVSVIVLSGPAATLAAVSGLSAAVYLVLRHSASTHAGPDTLSLPTVVGAVSFTFAGLVATAFPLQAPWLPLAAPLAVVAIYLLATWPFLGERKS